MGSIEESTQKAQSSFAKKIVSSLWGAFAQLLPNMASLVWLETKKNTPDGGQIGWDVYINDMVDKKMIDRDTGDMLKAVKLDPFPMDFINMLMTRMAIFRKEIESDLTIYGLDRQYAKMAQTTPNPAPVDNLIRAMIIDPARSDENRLQLKKHGYSDTQIDNIVLSYYRTTDEGTLKVAYLRGIITEETLYERLHELGYTDTRIQEILPTWELLPSPQDLFAMVAHEAFEPEIYIPLGLDKEFPVAQVEWLKKQGISEDWAKHYWRAHWEQPSIGQGFEMLHRGVIDDDTLNMLFKTVEIPSYWRDKLTQIAYNPYTRVDVRRMHDMGVLDDEQLIRAYMDLGYDSEKALGMAEFTIKYNSGNEKELTRSTIISSYEKKLIDRKDAKELLTGQDYTAALAEYYLTLADYNEQLALQDLLFSNIHDRYLLRDLSDAQVRDELSKMGLLGEKVEALLAAWALEQYKHTRLPSMTDLEDFLLREIITEDQYRAMMHRHGYDAAHINWFLEAMKQPTAAAPRQPTRTDLEHWFTKNIISEAQWYDEMKKLRYGDAYISYYFAEIE